MEPCYRLTITCPDRVGIVAKVGEFLAKHGGWITEANHHSDPTTGCFFMRHEIRIDSLPISKEAFKEAFRPIAEEFDMHWSITESQVPKRVVLFASKASHCLADILHRWHSGDLFCDLVGVISNHEDLRGFVEWHGIPYEYIPVPKGDADAKGRAFEEIDQAVKKRQADVLVLARYMQIMPPSICQAYTQKIINIHHSFLPSFIGAKPYHQAAQRGVKLIGATCHYVTDELDAGPIIEQDVVRVSHRDSVEDMVRLGKDVERTVLARGLRNHLEDRVLLHGNKTVIFA